MFGESILIKKAPDNLYSTVSNKYLVLQCRNLGDAIISTGLINSLGKSLEGISIDVFTKYSFKAIFDNNPYINRLFFANFPMGSPKGINIKTLLVLFKQIYRLRKHNYDVCLNREGDFRENLIGKLLRPDRNISVIWSGNHVYNSMIRKGFSRLIDYAIHIPEEIVNVYSANDYVAAQLGCTSLESSKIFLNADSSKNTCSSNNKIVAIHPGASKKNKLWSYDKWNKLISKLVLQGFHVWIFGTPSQKANMQAIFRESIDEKYVILQTGSLSEFFVKVSFAKLLIGLDSFSVHAGYALNVPVIMLNGANDHRIFKPPHANVIAKGNVCAYYPCCNKPKCLGSKSEYICMNSIEVDDVMAIINNLRV
jgi:heptosyltransferase-3